MTFTRRFLPVSITLALCACGSDPVLTDRDGGAPPVDAEMSVIDGGRGDAGPPAIDGGPACATRDPELPDNPALGEWRRGYANPGVGGDLPNVNAFGFGLDGEVYVGGEFTTAGYAAARNIAVWDGATGWAALGEGVPGRARSIAVAPDGAVYVAHGAAEHDFEATQLSRWDGTSWTVVADTTGSIEEIAFVGTTLLAAGGFTQIGGIDIAGLARWDGTTWTGYDGLAPEGPVLAISATSLDDVCIAGEFASLGVIESRSVACWNGTEWLPRALPLEHYLGAFDLQRDPADGSLVVAGNFMIDETELNGGSIARWVGDHWELIGGGVMSESGPGSTKNVRGIAFAPSGMYIGGAFRVINAADPIPVNAIARWSGTVWEDIGSVYAEVGFIGGFDNVYAVAAGPDGSVYFGGLFTRSDTIAVSHVVRFDGTYWSSLRTHGEEYEGVAGSVSALEREGTCAVYVGGTFSYAGTVRANNIARFTPGEGYEALGAGVVGTVQAIETLGQGRIVIGGDFLDESGTVFANVALWDGVEWRGLGGSVDGLVNALASVTGDTPDGRELVYVGGNFENAGDVPAEDLAMWDGERWTAIGGGFDGYPYSWDPTGEERSDPQVRAILRDPATGDLIVAGEFRAVGPDELVVNNIARWDGEQWHAFGDGLGGLSEPPNALAFWNGRLVVAGDFHASGDTPVGRVVTWTGTAWETVGTLELEDYSHLFTLEPVGSALYVGGSFRIVDGGGSHVAVYDGTTWSHLESGASDIVNALVAMEEGVYVGGHFDRTGVSPSVGLSLWQFAR